MVHINYMIQVVFIINHNHNQIAKIFFPKLTA